MDCFGTLLLVQLRDSSLLYNSKQRSVLGVRELNHSKQLCQISYRHLNPPLGQFFHQEHQCTQVLELCVIQQLKRGAVISVLSLWEFYGAV